MEYLRYVVGAGDTSDSELVAECTRGIAMAAGDPTELVPICQRLVANQARSAVLVWLAGRVLGALDPEAELAVVADEHRRDTTYRAVADELPEGGSVAVVGSGQLVADAFLRRGDVEAVLVDSLGLSDGLLRRLERADNSVEKVSAESTGIAVVDADLLLIEAVAAAPDRIVALCGARAAAAVAHVYGTPVLTVVALGRSMPSRVLSAMIGRLGPEVDSSRATLETVRSDLAGRFLDHRGIHESLTEVDVPDLAELRLS